MNELRIKQLKANAKRMRETALEMAYNSGGSAHLGGGLSIIDTLSLLYGEILNVSDKTLAYEMKDKFILSKGHGVLGLYTALAEFNVIDRNLLSTFMKNESNLIAHPVMNETLGIEASSGSLGQGISMAVGLALAAKKKNYSYQTYVICGNGECNEGSVWESCMSAVSYKLDNFTLFIDNNNMQSDGDSTAVMDISTKYFSMLTALGFETYEVDGHDIAKMWSVLDNSRVDGKPRAIVLNTVKGKGVSFMENNPEWHHNRLTKEQYEAAIAELRNRE